MKLATLCYVKAGGKTLMLHRIKRPDDMHAGKWNGLGGKLLPGESPEECVVREVEEECGLRLHQPELRGFLTFPSFSADEDWYAFVFVGRDFSGQQIECSEGVLEWVEDARLLELNLWEGDRIFLRWLEEERFFSGKFVYRAGRYASHTVSFYLVQTQRKGPDARAREDDSVCWLCGSPTVKRHCKIICTACNFTRDCSDP